MTTRIAVEGFFCHDRRALDLPVGVTLVTGRNGAGKSSLVVESIAWALFGKTLRGAPPGDAPTARVSFGDVDVERKRVKKAASLSIAIGGRRVAYETPTKAQEALEAHLGVDFAGWRRTHLFSATGVAQFSEATDAERKRLLEALLGLDRFDAALAQCRAELAALRRGRQARTSSLAVLRRAYDLARQNVEDARAELAAAETTTTVDEAVEGPDLDDLELQLSEVEALLGGELAQRRDEAIARYAGAEERLRVARRELDSGSCLACGRPFDSHDPKALADAVADAEIILRSAADVRAAAAAAVSAVAARRRELVGAVDAARRQREAAARAREEEAARAEFARSRFASFEAQLRAADGELEDVEVADAVDAAEEATLERCERVLGLKGARALVLSDALSAVADAANDYLADLSPGTSVSLEVPPGGAAIALSVEGLASGTYEGSSTGERCRLDVALLLAIATVAPPVNGLPLVFDDVFGSLDEAGVDAVAGLLRRIGADRRVVVITQLDALVERVDAVQVVAL